MKRIVAVLGMHRSGTSAMTRGLRVLGVPLGDNFLPPLEGNNPKGFWEDAEINELNIAILNALGSDWHFLAPFPENYLAILRHKGFFLRAVMLLRKKLKNTSVFGFKDPRVPMLLSFWQEVFTECRLEVSYVLVLRNPISVALSLAKRDGFGPAKSHLLWLRSVISSLSVTKSATCVVVDFDSLMQSPSVEMHRVARALQLEVDQTGLDTYINEFLDGGLRHTTFAPDDVRLDECIPPLVAEIYLTLNATASENYPLKGPKIQRRIKGWSDLYRQLHASLSLVDDLSSSNQDYARNLAIRDQEIAKLLVQLAARDGVVTELSATVQSLLIDRNAHKENGENLAKANSALSQERDNIAFELSKSVDSVIADRDARMREVELLRVSTANAQQDKEVLSERLTSVTEENVGLSQMIEKLTGDRAAVERQLENANELLSAARRESECVAQEASRKVSESLERERLLREIADSLAAERASLADQLRLAAGEEAQLWRVINSLTADRDALKIQLAEALERLATARQEQDAIVQEATQNLRESAERERLLREKSILLAAEKEALEDKVKSAKSEVLRLAQITNTAVADRDALKEELACIGAILTRTRQVQEAFQQDTLLKLAESSQRELVHGETINSLIIDRDAHKSAVEGLVESRDKFEMLLRQSHKREASLENSLNSVKSELFAVYRSRSWKLNMLLRKITNRGHLRRHELAALASPDCPPQVDAAPVMIDPFVPRIPIPEGETAKPRILLVSYYCPTRAHAGGLRILDLYSLIRKQCPTVQLDLFTHHRPNIDWSLEDVHLIFDNVYLSPDENLTCATLALLRQSSQPYDVIDLQFHQSAYGLDGFRSIGQRIIYTPMESLAKVLFYDLRSLLGKGGQVRLTKVAASLRNAAEEISHCRKADTVVCVSRADAAFLRMVTAQRNVEGIDTGISTLEFAKGLEPDYSPLPAAQRPQKILYVAYFGSKTNVQALRWFLDNVHPLIRAKVPGYVLSVVGRGDLTAFANDHHESIEFVGEVPAIAPYVSGSRVGIAPALSGSGFRGKVNQYAVMGVPSVVSSIAFKGLSYRHGRDIFVEDLPEEFANRCISLLVDTELNDQMGKAARRQCIDRYSWESKWPALRKIYGLEAQA